MLSDACQLTLKHPISGTQLILMTDQSFKSVRYAIMVEDKRSNLKVKLSRLSLLGSKIFCHAQLKRGYSRVRTHFVGSIKTNGCVNAEQISHPFLSEKAIPPPLWNACDQVLQFNFQIARITVSANRSADFLSRLELKVTEKIHLKMKSVRIYKHHPSR